MSVSSPRAATHHWVAARKAPQDEKQVDDYKLLSLGGGQDRMQTIHCDSDDWKHDRGVFRPTISGDWKTARHDSLDTLADVQGPLLLQGAPTVSVRRVGGQNCHFPA